MGQGSYGECYKADIKDIIIHSGIFRSIAHTGSNPWVAIFPFLNGPCLGKIMQLLHYDKGTFKRIVKKRLISSKLGIWHGRVEKERSKKACDIDTQFILSKTLQVEQARHALLDKAACLLKENVTDGNLPCTI